MTNSDDPCPHCGKKEWWLDSRIPDKKMKHITLLSYCSKCGWQFKRIVPLHLIKGKKLVEEKKRNLSKWQLFCADGLKQGKTLKELSYLYWHEWQTNNKFPTSLASLNSSTKGEPDKQ
jgi:hypothetical protein